MIYFINIFNSLKNNLTTQTINIAYKLLYFFSFCQIYLYKINNYISPNFTHLDKYLKDKWWFEPVIIKKFIILDIDGNIKRTIFIKDEHEHSITEHYDILLNDSLMLCDNKDGCINYVIYKNFTSSTYKLSNIKFLSIELDYNNNKYLINLKDKNYNYYVVYNCLNKTFFKYYAKNILKLNINEDNFNYTITIIDDNVKIINVLPSQSIIINKNNYQIEPK